MDQNRREVTSSGDSERAAIETDIAGDLRALTAVSEQLGQVFARSNNLRPNDFRALLHIATAEFEGAPLTPGRLGRLMGMSSPAATYLVDRMIESGHLRRDSDASDRRRILLHQDKQGMAAAQDFFVPVGTRTRTAIAEFSGEDLLATHRVLTTVIAALRDHLDTLTTPPAQ